MIKYAEMKKKIFASGTIPNGYNGNTSRVGFAWHEKQTIIVAQCGYYYSPLPDSFDEKEAFSLLQNHPLSTVKNLSKGI